MTGDSKDPQLAIIPKVFPIEVGETAPIGHSLYNPLPADGNSPNDFKPWFDWYQWAMTKNNGKPVTRLGDRTIFHPSKYTSTLTNENLPGESILQYTSPTIDPDLIIFIAILVLAGHPLYKSTYATTETTAITKLDNFLFTSPNLPQESTIPQLGANGLMADT